MENISNIDDLLMGTGNSQQPTTPEHKEKTEELPETPEKETVEEYETDDVKEPEIEENEEKEEKEESTEKENLSDTETELDEYGNTKERMSKGMKERLDRKEKQHQREIEEREQELQALRQQLSSQGANKEVQQAVKDFKFDEKDSDSWEKQLADFVKHTVNNMHVEEQQKIRAKTEETAHREFAQKFTKGMDRFSDFREVVGRQPIDDAMTLSLRAINDPSAFIYAASKRESKELERISKLSDPYAKIAEMARLEERMRKTAPSTKTPKPLGRIKEDSSVKEKPKEKDTTGDDLLAKADAKRLSTVKNRHKSNR
jgi:hypothetical protein